MELLIGNTSPSQTDSTLVRQATGTGGSRAREARPPAPTVTPVRPAAAGVANDFLYFVHDPPVLEPAWLTHDAAPDARRTDPAGDVRER